MLGISTYTKELVMNKHRIVNTFWRYLNRCQQEHLLYPSGVHCYRPPVQIQPTQGRISARALVRLTRTTTNLPEGNCAPFNLSPRKGASQPLSSPPSLTEGGILLEVSSKYYSIALTRSSISSDLAFIYIDDTIS